MYNTSVARHGEHNGEGLTSWPIGLPTFIALRKRFLRFEAQIPALSDDETERAKK